MKEEQMKKILVIDDEASVIQTIRTYFITKGFTVLGAENATIATELLIENPAIVLLDIMMPGIDGISFCQQIRQQILCPIIFLSALTEENSKIKSLSSGGDDYITKPFSIKELHARIEAHLRRESRPRNQSTRIQYGSFWIDYGRNEAGVEDQLFNFTKKEYGIIDLLSSNTGQVFSQNRIYETVWGYDADGDANTSVMEHVKRIRKKLEVSDCESLIETVWGIGYRWRK